MDNGSAAELAPSFEIATVLGDTFGLMRDRPIAVFGVALLISLPTRLWLIVLPTLAAQLNITSYAVGFAFGGITSGLIAGIMQVFGQGALITAARARNEERKAGFLETLSAAIRRAPMLLSIALIGNFGIMLGLICLIIPGIMLSLMWSVAGPVAVAEGTGVVETFRRSQALTDNILARLFGLMLISGAGGGAYSWIAHRIGEALFGVGAKGLVYPFSPAPFFVVSMIDSVRTAFDLALFCSLYIALVRRDGGGPMYQHLNRIFE